MVYALHKRLEVRLIFLNEFCDKNQVVKMTLR
jgi:hypothetical protein